MSFSFLLQIYARTGDEHFSLIIVDCDSEDMDIEQEAKKSSFKRSLLGREGGTEGGTDYKHCGHVVGSMWYI